MYKNTYKLSATMLVILLVLSMQSCFVAKEYERPALSLGEDYRDFQSRDTLTLGKLPWQILFADDTLRSLIARGLENNYDMAIAYENILAAQAVYKRGKADLYPALNLNATASSSKFSENGGAGLQFQRGSSDSGAMPGRIEQFELNASLSWEADIWGKIASNKRAAFATFRANQAEYRAVQTQLIAAIATSYYELLALDRQLEIAKQTLSVREESLQTILSLKKAGDATRVAVKQTEAQMHTAELLVLDVQLQIVLLENTLSVLMAQPPQPIERSSMPYKTNMKQLELGIPAELLRNRPDILKAEYQLISAFEMENVARADFYPTLSVTPQAGFESLELSNWFSTSSFFNRLVGGIAQPVFNRRRIRTAYEVAKAEQKIALYNFKQRVLNASQEVASSLKRCTIQHSKIKVIKKQIASLSTALKDSQALLVNGYANYLELLRADSEKLNAEMQLINTQFEHKAALVDLYRSLGGGWQQDFNEPNSK